MSDQFIGEIRMFAGTYSPQDWAFCDGQLLNIVSYQALYSIVGVTYGGNGTTTFALPDLRGRAPIHKGAGPGLTPHNLAERGGAEQVALNVNQLPSHNHLMKVGSRPDTTNPSNCYLGTSTGNLYDNSAGSNTLAAAAITPSGESQPHTNMQPYLAINFIIALNGEYPPRD